MFRVVRPGGAVYLAHSRNEGERQRYTGMHRWNLDAAEVGAKTHFIVWNHARRVDITDELAGAADVTVKAMPEWINVVIKKHKK